MGATNQSILRIFLYEGLFIGVVGTFLGFIVGYMLCWAQMKYKFFSIPGDVYFINTLPVKMEIPDFVFIGVAAVLLCLLAALYPAVKASKMDPIAAIRHE